MLIRSLTRPVRVFAADLGRVFPLGDDNLLDLDEIEELEGLIELEEGVEPSAFVNGAAAHFFRTALVTRGVFD